MTTGFKGPIVHGNRSNQEGYAYRNRMAMMSAAEWNVLHEDFNGVFTTNATTNWAAIIDVGGTNITHLTAAAGANGVVAMTSDAVSEGTALYGAKSIQLTSGKKWFMECRFQLDDVTDQTFYFGLSALTAVTNPEDIYDTTTTDFCAFGILDATTTAALTQITYDKSNGGPVTNLGTKSLTAATWITAALYFDGTNLSGYVNGDLSVVAATVAQIPTGVALAPFVAMRIGDGAAPNTALVDYIRVVSER